MDYLKINKDAWNKRTKVHIGSVFYDIESFKNGKCSLNPIELEQVGDVKGKTLLHLQCHFGQDTLSWALWGQMSQV
jgi:membrane protein involved in colicin uptake